MKSLIDAQRLQRLGEFRQRRCERALQQIRQQLQPIEGQLAGFYRREDSLHALIAAQRPDGSLLRREQLLDYLRAQAVLRRQLHTLAIDRVRADEQLADLNVRMRGQLDERAALQRRRGKYQTLCKRLDQQRRATLRGREEIENEDAQRLAAGTGQ